jgi:spoIIIJ-associated protein
MERTNVEIIADSVDEAVAQGLAQMGLPMEMVQVEVLDAGSRGFLGIGGRQVRVRLTAKGEGQAASAPESLTRAEVQASSGAVPAVGDELLDLTRETVHTLLSKMKVDANVTAVYGDAEQDGDRPVLVDIRGEDLSVLIGRRSETLNSLQYIAGLMVSKKAGHYVQLFVDVEGFRTRREKQLRQLARRMAEQAIRTGKRQVLEPMSAADRRVVHLELRDETAVTTESIGAEPNRKVTIVPR